MVMLRIEEVSNRLAPCDIPKEQLRAVVEKAIARNGIRLVSDPLAPQLVLRVTGYLNDGYGKYQVELRLDERVEVTRPGGRCTAIATTWSRRSSEGDISATSCDKVANQVLIMSADFGLLGRLNVPGVVP
jgi:hypothetical protein